MPRSFHRLTPGKQTDGPPCAAGVWVRYCLLLIMLGGAAFGEPVFTVRMKGYAEGVGLTARRLAVADAQQQVMADVLRSMTHSDDMAPFRNVLREAARYIHRHELLHTETDASTTAVEIDAFVLEKPLRHDVATIMLPRLPRKPSVLLVMAEYVGPEAAAGGPTFDVAESVFRERIEEFKFPVSGIHSLVNHFDVEQLIEVIHGDVAAGAAFARAATADVVIIGTVVTAHEPLTSDSNMVRNRATAVLRVFSGPDGKMMDALSAQAVVQSVDVGEGGEQAVRDACAKLTGECIVSIVLTTLALEDDRRVLVEIREPRTEEAMAAVEAVLNGMPGVYGVERLFFSETLGRFAVEYTGSMAYFSDMITGRFIDTRRTEVIRCVMREVTLILQ